MYLVIFVGLHTFLYLLWRGRSTYENRTRTDNLKPVFYWTGDIGDTIGFTLVMVAWHWTADLKLFAICVTPACLITYGLHRYWSRVAVVTGSKTASLYLKNGAATLGGKLHLLYVVFVSTVSIACVYQLFTHVLTPPQIQILVSGIGIYVCTVIIDKYRGVI